MPVEVRPTHERVEKRREQQEASFKIIANDNGGFKGTQTPELSIGEIIDIPIIVCDHMNLLSTRALLYRSYPGSAHLMTEMAHDSLQNC